jgi:hypothetical protein
MDTVFDKVEAITNELIKMGKRLCINKFSHNIFYQKGKLLRIKYLCRF